MREAVIERFGTDAISSLAPGMVREVIIGIRKGKLPEVTELGSAGSFFRNPYVDADRLETIKKVAQDEELGPVPSFALDKGLFKVPAAWLIDKCGLKGRKHGGAAVYEKQPLVIVNHSGSAEPGDVIALEEEVKAAVFGKFGVRLEKEVEYV